jgi:hypothetical protein
MTPEQKARVKIGGDALLQLASQHDDNIALHATYFTVYREIALNQIRNVLPAVYRRKNCRGCHGQKSKLHHHHTRIRRQSARKVRGLDLKSLEVANQQMSRRTKYA